MVNFNIKVVSDTICPWCWLGQARMNKAIDIHKRKFPDDTFTITWHPYFLEPGAPAVGVPTKQRMADKFGADRAQAMQATLRRYGASSGINYTFEGRRGSTRDSHRLIHMAGQMGPSYQNKLVAAIFKSYFEDGGDLTSKDMLADAAERAGIDRGEAKKYLDDPGAGGAAVDREVAEAMAGHISAVPHIVVEGRFTFQGADDPEEVAEGLERLRESMVGE